MNNNECKGHERQKKKKKDEMAMITRREIQK